MASVPATRLKSSDKLLWRGHLRTGQRICVHVETNVHPHAKVHSQPQTGPKLIDIVELERPRAFDPSIKSADAM